MSMEMKIKCSNCKKCACDKPGTRIKKKGQHRTDVESDSNFTYVQKGAGDDPY